MAIRNYVSVRDGGGSNSGGSGLPPAYEATTTRFFATNNYTTVLGANSAGVVVIGNGIAATVPYTPPLYNPADAQLNGQPSYEVGLNKTALATGILSQMGSDYFLLAPIHIMSSLDPPPTGSWSLLGPNGSATLTDGVKIETQFTGNGIDTGQYWNKANTAVAENFTDRVFVIGIYYKNSTLTMEIYFDGVLHESKVDADPGYNSTFLLASAGLAFGMNFSGPTGSLNFKIGETWLVNESLNATQIAELSLAMANVYV